MLIVNNRISRYKKNVELGVLTASPGIATAW